MRGIPITMPCILIAGLLGVAIVPAPVHATPISGTFTGNAQSFSDPDDVLGLGGVNGGDVISGNFAFDSLLVSGNTSSDNLSITITDTTTGNTATFTDALGSTYNVTTGQYQVTANGPDPNDSSVTLTFNAASILADDLEQSFVSGPGDNSSGFAIANGGAELGFSITNADVEVLEPNTLSVIGMGLMGLVAVRRRRAA
jgi:hypothetical protein